MNYYYAHYRTGEVYISAYDGDDYYADVTICLAEYDCYPGDNQIIIPVNKIRIEDLNTYLGDLIEKPIKYIEYGPYKSRGLLAQLKENWKEKCFPLEE